MEKHALAKFWDKYRALDDVARLSAIEIKNSLCEEIWTVNNPTPKDLTFRCKKCRICRIRSALESIGYL